MAEDFKIDWDNVVDVEEPRGSAVGLLDPPGTPPIDWANVIDIPDTAESKASGGEVSLPDYLVYKYKQGKVPIYKGYYGVAAREGKMTAQEAIEKSNRDFLSSLDENGVIDEVVFKDAPVRYLLGEATRLLPFIVEGGLQSLEMGTATGTALAGTALAAGQMGPQIAVPEELLTVPGAFLAGLGGGAAAGVFKFSYDVAGGISYLDAIEKGIKPETANYMSIAAGIGEGLVEIAQMNLLAAPFKRLFVEELAKPGVKSFLGRMAKNLLLSTGVQVAEEEAQSVVELTALTLAAWVDKNPNAAPTQDDWLKEIVQTAIQTAAGFMVLGLPGAMVGAYIDTESGKITPSKEVIDLAKKFDISEEQLNSVVEEQLNSVVEEQLNSVVEEQSKSNSKKETSSKKLEVPEIQIPETVETDISEEKLINPKQIIAARENQMNSELRRVRVDMGNVLKTIQDYESKGMSVEDLEIQLTRLQNKQSRLNRALNKLVDGPDISLEGFSRKQIKMSAISFVEEKLKSFQIGLQSGEKFAKETAKKVQTSLIDMIERSALSDTQKKNFQRTIKNIQTSEQLSKAIPQIKSRVKMMLNANYVRAAKNEISKTLKSNTPKTVSGKPVGKLTPEIYTTLKDLQQIKKLKANDVGVEYAKMYEETVANPEGVTFEQSLRVRYSALLSGNMDAKGAELLLDDIKTLVTEGREVFTKKQEARKATIEKNRAEAVKTISGGTPLPKSKLVNFKSGELGNYKTLIAKLTSPTANWKNVLDILSIQDPSKAETSFLNRWGNVEIQNRLSKKNVRIALQTIRENAQRIFNIERLGKLDQKFNEDNIVEVVGTFIDRFGERIVLKASRSQLRKLWMEWQDPSLESAFNEGMGYTDEIRDVVETYLTDEDKAFVHWQLDFYRKMYSRVNDVYKRVYGVDLPFNEFYSPVRRDGLEFEGLDTSTALLEEVKFRISDVPKSLKSRAPKSMKKILLQSDTYVLQQHIADMEHFIVWKEKLQDLKSVFGDPNVRKNIHAFFGKGIQNKIQGFLDDFSRGGIDRKNLILAIEKLRTNYITSVIMAKPQIFFKQLFSYFAYAETIPIADFAKNSALFFKDPQKNFRTMTDMDFIKDRGDVVNLELASVLKSDEFKKFNEIESFKNMMMLNVRLGDKAPMIVGGWAIYKYHLDKTGSHEKAVQIFEEVTNDTQQSSDLSQLSSIQRGGTFARIFTPFRSTGIAYINRELNAIRNAIAGRMTKKQALKVLAIYHVLLPSLYQWAVNAFRWDDDDQLNTAILGPFSSLPLAGEALEFLLAKIKGEKSYTDTTFIYAISQDIGEMAQIINDDDITTEDVLEALRGLAGASGAATGIGAKPLLDMGLGTSEFIGGNYEKGLVELMGYSPGTVKKITKKRKSKEVVG